MKESSKMTEKNLPGIGKMGGVRLWMAVWACLLLLLVPFAGGVSAQNADPQPTQDPAQLVPNDPTAPQPTGNQDAATPTEPATNTTNQQAAPRATPAPDENDDTGNQSSGQVSRTVRRADEAAGPGFPAVLAHGLAYVSGDEIVWQVRETEIPDADSAKSTTSNAAILMQREGSSIVRNDVTGKRAKTDTGEAFFRAAGDGYTVIAEGDESIVWTFELVSPDDVAIDAFYESPTIEDLDEGVYDMMLTRFVLQPDESVDLPDHNGAGLVMVNSGEIVVTADDDRSALEQGDGQTIPGRASVTNSSAEDAVFVYVYLGDEVGDETAGAPQPQDSDATTDETTGETDDAADDAAAADPDTLQDDADAGTASAEEGEVPATDDAGNYLTSIDVTADAEIYLIITVDGLTVFDGTLPAGASSGPVIGTTFEVYTSSGVNTNFTNACGDYFKMGYEEGEVTYYLEATESSCAP